MTRQDLRRLTTLAVLTMSFASTERAIAQSVTLSDEQVVRPAEDDRERIPYEPDTELHLPLAKLSPDGRVLLYDVRPKGEKPGSQFPPQIVIRQLRSPAGKPQEFRPMVPGGGAEHRLIATYYYQTLSLDGKTLLLNDFADTGPQMRGGPWPLFVCDTSTGKVVKTNALVDARYARIDGTGRFILAMGGQAYSLAGGKGAPRLGYAGFVESANPVLPLVLTNSGVEGSGKQERHIFVWDLKEDKAVARLPTNPNHPYTDEVDPLWTRDGMYVYFNDLKDQFVGATVKPEDNGLTRVWSLKSGALVGEPFEGGAPYSPGPTPTSMILHRRFDPKGFTLHDVETGARADIPLRYDTIMDVAGDKIAYMKQVGDVWQLCVATLNWGTPRAVPGKPAPATKPTRGVKPRTVNSR